MKKNVLIAGTLLAATMTAAGAVNAAPSTHSIYLNGQPVAVEGYAIAGNNYFKLRDLAKILSDTEKQFEVAWNALDKRIDLTSNKPYTTVGGELAEIEAGQQDAKASKAVVYKDGAPANYTGYTINENNYYMLRDIAKSMGIEIEWNGTTKRVDILTQAADAADDETPAADSDQTEEPETPSTPTTSEEKILRDYRQDGDPGIRSANLGNAENPMYDYYPSYGKYSAAYQNLLDTCGEPIVTKTIKYYTFCSQTNEKGTLSGFPMEVRVVDDRITPNRWYVATMLYIDAGEGEFQLKMPKSLYDKILAGSQDVFAVAGSSVDVTSQRTIINGKVYEIHSNRILHYYIRDNNPMTMRLELAYYEDDQQY